MANFVRLKTSVPGPLSRQLLEARKREVAAGVFSSAPIFVRSAHGVILTDVDGNQFLDFAGGIGTVNVGHSNPEVVRAATAQMENFTQTCFSVAMYESYVKLAEILNRITPGNFPKKTMLANSGAEAVENAVKIARHATGRQGIVVFEHAFHGRTLLAAVGGRDRTVGETGPEPRGEQHAAMVLRSRLPAVSGRQATRNRSKSR